MNYLIVAAHPDDEVLGAGATMYKLAQQGEKVCVCILSGSVRVRNKRPSDIELKSDIDCSISLIGASDVIIGDFPNIEFNTVPHLHLVQFIEKAIVDTKADVVITHHPADTNNDHYHTSIACQAAIRLFQRSEYVKPIQAFMFMEVPSATDWSVNRAMNVFVPNTFFEVGMDGVEVKIKALSQYREVMRDYPHSRSREALLGLATFRGSQAKMNYAEAFECVFRRGI